jgi:hypothetical protein
MAVFVRRVGLSRKRTFRAVLRRRERAHGCRLDEHPLHLKADIVRIEFIGRHRADIVEKLDFLPRSQFLRQLAGFKKKAMRVRQKS